MESKALLTIKDVEIYLSMKESTIRRDVKLGKFPEPVRVNKNVLWRKTDLDAWVEQLSSAPPKVETRGRKRLAA